MRYKLLGRSGLRVSEFALGTMTFGEEWGWGSNTEDSKAIFDAYLAAGGNFIDTANFYTQGSSERILSGLIQAERERLIVATKYTLTMNPHDLNAGGNHRKNMIQAVEASLKRLKTDYIDLLWLHVWDFTTPIQEVMHALDTLVRQGKVFYIGISDTPAWIVAQGNTLAELRGWNQFVALQIEYSLIERTPERDLIPMAEAFGLTVTPWSPLAGGLLSGKYAGGVIPAGARLKPESARLLPQNLAIAATVGEIAKETTHSSAQIALAWLRYTQPNSIPIIGARTLAQLQDNLGSLTVELTEAQLTRLNDASKVDLGFPHRFLHADYVQKNIFGNGLGQLDF